VITTERILLQFDAGEGRCGAASAYRALSVPLRACYPRGMHSPARVIRLAPGAEAIAICARWRHDAFLKELDYSYEGALRQLDELVARQDGEAALLAEVDGVPAGTCLYVRDELEPHHDLTPWLAGLYVAPEFRGRGVARDLVAAIERHAGSVGCRRLYLYTVTAEGLYVKCGWAIAERFDWGGAPFVLMQKDL